MTAKIESIKIKHILDDAGLDFISDLGTYTDRPEPWAICRKCGEYLHNAERYNRVVELIEEAQNDIAIECDNQPNEALDRIYDIMTIARQKFETKEHDCTPYRREYAYFLPFAGGMEQGTKDYQTYGMQDYNRAESYNNQNWHYMGIQAIANVSIDGQIQTITSGGLWGIESDSDESYLKEVAQEEIENLKSQLSKLGVTWDDTLEIEQVNE